MPELTAAWLAEDPQVWLSLLTRANVVERRAAATALERLLHGPIPVDPAADPATQKTQFEKLRRESTISSRPTNNRRRERAAASARFRRRLTWMIHRPIVTRSVSEGRKSS